ncbi:MAG: hypothetical protein P4L85_08885 [Paludisphaera borealis]|uniref:hypothetical protein n=1 Tax=Paludisphaera borealis TaxID=1387353 RepID=UPI00284297F8|nr:hypothetical protein [Paludisphaera borealis]MDR3619452.1 hypothetical protein [Paludisphaera borealis]
MGILVAFCGVLMGSLASLDRGRAGVPGVVVFLILEFVAPLYFILHDWKGATRLGLATIAVLLGFFAWGAGFLFSPFPHVGRLICRGGVFPLVERASYGFYFLFYLCLFLSMISIRPGKDRPSAGRNGRLETAITHNSCRTRAVHLCACLLPTCCSWSILYHGITPLSYHHTLSEYVERFAPRAHDLLFFAIVFLPINATLFWNAQVARRNAETPRKAVRKRALAFHALLIFLWSGAIALRFLFPSPPPMLPR